MIYLIDIVGTCNLRCPSCPVGNFEQKNFLGDKRPKGFMKLDLFKKIIGKIKADNPDSKPNLWLYNWGEALLHPQITDFLREIAEAGLTAEISTNLNSKVDLGEIVEAQLGQIAGLRISLSGFTQEVYQRGHKGGKVALVKSNMYRLRHYMDMYKKNIPIHVYYHVYRDNAGDELIRMSQLCQELGFSFWPSWAYFMPLEKVFEYLNIKYETASSNSKTTHPVIPKALETRIGQSKLSHDDEEIISRLVIPIEKMVEMAKKVHIDDCYLRSSQTAINFDGSVSLCCAVYDPAFTIAESFLSSSQDELQRLKYSHPLCITCMDNHFPQIAMYMPPEDWDSACNAVLKGLGVPNNISMFGGAEITKSPLVASAYPEETYGGSMKIGRFEISVSVRRSGLAK